MNLLPILIAAFAISPGEWVHVPGGTWEPSTRQVDEVRAALPAEFQRAATEYSASMGNAPAFDRYAFQYLGIAKDGHQELFVAGSCHPEIMSDADFRNGNGVKDGGKCFFEVAYDPEHHRFHGFRFHGGA